METSETAAEDDRTRESRLARQLKEDFSDTLDQGNSRALIAVRYLDSRQNPRTEVGIPYTIEDGNLVLGPYAKDIVGSAPEDYDKAKRPPIPLKDIRNYVRQEIPFFDLTSTS